MSRSHPHPLSLFSLLTDNERAREALHDRCNAHLVWKSGNEEAIDIGLHTYSKADDALTLLGRNADIVINFPNISKSQCHFALNPNTGIVMLHDTSSFKLTQVYGTNSMPYIDDGRPRKIAVLPELNDIFGMGGPNRDFVQFKIMWNQNLDESIEKAGKIRAELASMDKEKSQSPLP